MVRPTEQISVGLSIYRILYVYIQYNRIKFSYYVFLLEKYTTCHICMILWEWPDLEKF